MVLGMSFSGSRVWDNKRALMEHRSSICSVILLLFWAFALQETDASVLLNAKGGPLEFNAPPALKIGRVSYDIVSNVSILETTGCTVDSYGGNLTSSPAVVVIQARGCDNLVKARAAKEAGAIGILITERSPRFGKGYAGISAKQPFWERCKCDDLVVGFILDVDVAPIRATLAENGFATVRLTSDESGWVVAFGSGGFWFIQIFAILLNLGSLFAGIIRLVQFRQRVGVFELSVSQVSVGLEIVASAARFIIFLDPTYSRGFIPLLITTIFRQLAVCMTLMTNLLIGLFWLETTRKYADLVVSPWLRQFRVPFILGTSTILLVSIVGAIVIGMEISVSVVLAGIVDSVNFVIFGLSSIFYETVGVRIFLRLRSIQRKLPSFGSTTTQQESSSTSSSDISPKTKEKKPKKALVISSRKLSAVRRTAVLLLLCGIFMATYIIFGLIPASQSLTSVPAGVASGFFGLFLSLVLISLTKLWALRPSGSSSSSKVSSKVSSTARSKTSGGSSDQ